jgi:hypothetical protein
MPVGEGLCCPTLATKNRKDGARDIAVDAGVLSSTLRGPFFLSHFGVRARFTLELRCFL